MNGVHYGAAMGSETSALSDLKVVPYSEAMYGAYAEFARRSFGDGCYQASRSYLQWLYGVPRTPAPRPDDFLIAVSGGAVVGCMHKMRLHWKNEGELVEVPALHNWVVDERFRTGVGIVLLTKAMRSDRHAYISSAAGDLATVYRKLKCQEVQGSWYRKVLRPVAGSLRLGLYRLTKLEPKTHMSSWLARVAKGSSFGPLEVVVTPTEGDLDRMASSLTEAAGSGAHPHWTAESLRWRFFHPQGPRHICLRLRGSGTVSDDFVLVAVAPRRGLRTARLVEARLGSPDRARVLLRGTLRLSKKVGAHVLLGYSAHPTVNARLQDAGWSPLAGAQPSFLYHAAREPQFVRLAFNGSPADFGFDAISPE